MPDSHGQNGESRLDRIERAIEALTIDVQALTGSHRKIVGDIAAIADMAFRLDDGHKHLLRAQVILQDMVEKQIEVSKLSNQRMDRFEKGMEVLRESQDRTEQALHALIVTVDGMISRKPPEN